MVAIWCGVVWGVLGVVRCGEVMGGVVWYVAWRNVVWCDAVCGVVWCGVAWRNVV